MSYPIEVTPNAHSAHMTKQRGIMVVEDCGTVGMNAAIDLVIAVIRSTGEQPLVILPADLPLLTGSELDRLAGLFEKQASAGG